jgi:hypothetical protein
MSYGTRLLADPVRSLAGASFDASYQAVGAVLAHPARIIVFQNLTDASIMVSLDGGATDTFPLASQGMFVLDIASDKTTDNGLFLAAGTQISAKDLGVPSTGSFYVTIMYALGD